MKTRVILPVALLLLAAALFLNAALATEEKEKTVAEKMREWQKVVEKAKGTKFRKRVLPKPVKQKDMDNLIRTRIIETYTSSEQEAQRLVGMIDYFIPETERFGLSEIARIIAARTRFIYDPKEDRFYYIKSGGAELCADEAMREFAKALRDQHTDLAGFIEPDSDNLDRINAKLALVEGEAACMEIEQALRENKNDSEKTKPDEVHPSIGSFKPPAICDLLEFPRTYGPGFYRRYLEKHGVKKASGLYDNPPISTEQILHDNKFDGENIDYPVDVILDIKPEVLGPDWTEFLTLTMGEYGMLRLLGNGMDGELETWASIIGWDGDRWKFFWNKKTHAVSLIAATIWDSEEDAREFQEFIIRNLRKRWEVVYGQPTAGGPLPIKRSEFRAGKVTMMFVERNKNKVLLGVNLPPDSSGKIDEALAKTRFNHHKNDLDKGKNDAKSTLTAKKTKIKKLIEQSGKATLSGKTYKSRTGRWQITLPKGEWRQRKEPPLGIDLFMESKTCELGILAVKEDPFARFRSLDSAVKAIKRSMQMRPGLFDFVDEFITAVDGRLAYGLTYTYTEDNEKIKMTQIVTIHFGSLVTIIYASDKKNFETFKKYPQKAIKSFTFSVKKEKDKDKEKEPVDPDNIN